MSVHTGRTAYHALVTQFTKRFSSRWQASATYSLTLESRKDYPIILPEMAAFPQTHGGCTAPVTWNATFTEWNCHTPVNFAAFGVDVYSNSEWYRTGHQKHRAVFNAIYELPFGRGKHFFTGLGGWTQALFGGWQLQGWFEGQTGDALGFGNPEEAEEILQDTLLKIIRKIDTFREESDIWPWIKRIAINNSIMWLRKNRSSREREIQLEEYMPHFTQDGQLEYPLFGWAVDPEEVMLNSELSARLYDSIQSLPFEYRVPLVLRMACGAGLRAAASAARCSSTTIPRSICCSSTTATRWQRCRIRTAC